MAESFFATVETELILEADWPTRDAARQAIFAYIETWYNRERRHSSLGYRSPAQYERDVRAVRPHDRGALAAGRSGGPPKTSSAFALQRTIGREPDR